MRKIALLLCLSAVSLFAEEAIPKNIILFIGDGMGVAQITAAKVAKGSLEMERCPATALVTTWSDSSLVTDSAAGATAMATGIKTKNGALSRTTAQNGGGGCGGKWDGHWRRNNLCADTRHARRIYRAYPKPQSVCTDR
ncbi:MAG: alkaline phosphatase [Verrucomicrobia bacterium]|nr:alkaline phosphatase [Verrucomicrobiota bacterium]